MTTSTKPPLVIYHANCQDGFCAAWLMHRYAAGGNGYEFLPAQYGDAPPDVTGRPAVYVLDFSYPRETLLAMRETLTTGVLIVLDHHRTAEAALAGLPFCRFDVSKSGARLTWEWLDQGSYDASGVGLGPEDGPCLVRYVEDRDLWSWKLPYSKEVNAALASYPHDFTAWDHLAEFPDPEGLITEGEAILRYQNQQVESAIKQAGTAMIGGHEVPCVNSTTLISEIAGKLAESAFFAACFFVRADGKVVYSLRSREGGADVSEIAKRYGGGGHKAAAGFTADGILR